MAKVLQYFNFLNAKNAGNKGTIQKKKSVILLFFNKTQKDIIWRDQLDRLTNDNSQQKNREDFSIQIHHILSQEPDWSGPKGKISHEMLKELLPESDTQSSRRLACICGPTQFTESAQR
jgi:cytochrome-b5 reductase